MYSFRSYQVSGTVLNVRDVVVNITEGDIHRAGETINKIKSEIHSMICLEKKKLTNNKPFWSLIIG